MTTSGETYPRDERDAKRRLERKIERGRRDMLTAIAAITVITLPMIGWWTRDVTLTAFAAALVLVCGTFAIARYNQDAKREIREINS